MMGGLKPIDVIGITTRSEEDSSGYRDEPSSPASDRGPNKKATPGNKKKSFFRRSGLNPNAHNHRHGNNKIPSRQGGMATKIESLPFLDDADNEVENITSASRKEETKLRRRQRGSLQRRQRGSRSPQRLLRNGCDRMVPAAVLSRGCEEITNIMSETSEVDTPTFCDIRFDQEQMPSLVPWLKESSTSDSGAISGNPPTSDWVCYGDEIRLRCYSAFEKKWSYLGYVRRSGLKRNAKALGKGDLFMLPPAPKSSVFHEAAFKLIDPLGEREDGEPFHYGDVLTLSDERGMVWNNKSGRLHGLLGPSIYGYGGQMHMTFSPEMQAEEGAAGYKRGGEGEGGREEEVEDTNSYFNVRDGKGRENRAKGECVLYGDSFLIYAKKLRANKSGITRSAVTHQPWKKHGRCYGAYIRSDGKGIPLQFCVHRAPPHITAVAVYGQGPCGDQTGTYYNVPWEQELELNIPCGLPDVSSLLPPIVTPKSKHDDSESMPAAAQNNKPFLCDHGWLLPPPSSNVIRITLSNGGEVLLELQDLMVVGTVDKYRWFNVTDSTQDFRLKAHIQCLDAGEGQKGAIWTYLIAALIASLVSTALKAFFIFSSSARIWSMVGEITLNGKALWLSLEIASVCVSMLLASLLKGLMDKKKDGLSFTVVHRSSSHCYLVSFIKCESGRAEDASPDDEDIKSRIPPTFMEAEKGNFENAEKRWHETLAWRRSVCADDALTTPHYTFDICKRFYPSAFHGTDKTGAVVYYEHLGKIDIEGLKAQGVTPELLGWHYVWQMEYLWTKISPSYDGRVTIILDMKGVHVGDIKGEVSNFIRATVSMLERHYPARSDCIFILNVPWWFDMIWKLVKPLLSAGTRKKIFPREKSRVRDALLEAVDEDQLPQEYGGRSLHELFEHPMEINMRQHVLKVISKNGTRQIDEINVSKCTTFQQKYDQAPLYKQIEKSTLQTTEA